jgi:TolB protein
MARGRALYLPVMIAAAVLGACVVALLLAFSWEKAEASFPGKNGRIAYQGSDGVIYTINPINPTGEGKTKVRRGQHPAYSPDGTKIAYAASDGHDAEIYTVEAAGGRPFQVTDNISDDFHPAYSPDGTKIAYSCSDGHDLEICTTTATGGNSLRLTKNDTLDFGPSWSPSGKRIAYSGLTRTDWEVFTVDARGRGGRLNVTNNGTYDYYPDYSPGGTRIAYVAKDTRDEDTEIRKIKATGGKPRPLTNNNEEDLDPYYSPDGKRIVYTHYSEPDRPGKAAIYKIAAGGGRGVLVTANNGTGALDPSWGSRP